MDNNLPTNPLAVEAHLRALVDESTLAVLKRDGGSEYPFLFGMATVKLAEANQEIARLRELLAECSTDAAKIADMLEGLR